MLFQKSSSSLAALVLLAVVGSWHSPLSLAQELTTTPAQKELIRIVMRNIPFPIGRYTPWGDLTTELQTDLTAALEYDERTWNRPGRNKMEAVEYDRVCLKATGERTDSCDALDLLVEVGFTTAQSYECWAGHYDSYEWTDLQAIGADVHFEALGWSELAWTSQNETLVPQSFFLAWAGLDEAEQNAAIQLCYLPELWDEERLTGNWIDIYAPIYETATQELDDAMAAIMPSFPLERFVPYAFLDQDTLEVTAVLEYTENRWEKPGRFNLEEYPFDQLCEEWDGLPAGTQDCETVDALKMLGFTAESWDCWMFHYNYETWDELVASGKAQYYEEIGWTEALWTVEDESLFPMASTLDYDQLTYEQQVAATNLCYIQPLWDEEFIAEWASDYQDIEMPEGGNDDGDNGNDDDSAAPVMASSSLAAVAGLVFAALFI